MTQPSTKPVQWLGSSQDDLREFPEEVRDVIGYALYLAQNTKYWMSRMGYAHVTAIKRKSHE